jgi:hypothetical protein
LYKNEITGQEASWSNYTILQLTDLKVDPDYVLFASSECRELACCHSRDDGTIPKIINKELIAGPYGHKNCDTPYSGLPDILTSIRESLDEDPNLIFVTGGVVTDQTGQLTL